MLISVCLSSLLSLLFPLFSSNSVELRSDQKFLNDSSLRLFQKIAYAIRHLVRIQMGAGLGICRKIRIPIEISIGHVRKDGADTDAALPAFRKKTAAEA